VALVLDRVTDQKLRKQRIRQARYRSRIRRGITIWKIEIDQARYQNLVALGFLRADIVDAEQGALAVQRALDMIRLPPDLEQEIRALRIGRIVRAGPQVRDG
jgi:hypothetical protein